MHVIQLKNIVRSLQGQKPGFEAQRMMLPQPRPGTRFMHDVEDACYKAGVLILLYPVDGEVYLALTRRTESVDSHRGQISLPGGRKESDESLIEAALRETEEELGIGAKGLTVIGELTPLYIPPSQYCIYPTIAVADSRPVFRPSPEEVAELIELPLSHLLDDGNIVREEWTIRGMRVDVPFYHFQEYKIWGATAMVLAEFLVMVKNGIDLK